MQSYFFWRGFSIKFSNRALKDLKPLTASIQDTIFEEIEALVKDPNHHVDVIKLKNAPDLYRVKTGKYRTVFKPLDKEKLLYILLIDHRKQIYSAIKRYIA